MTRVRKRRKEHLVLYEVQFNTFQSSKLGSSHKRNGTYSTSGTNSQLSLSSKLIWGNSKRRKCETTSYSVEILLNFLCRL